MTNDQLTAVLAERIMGWTVGPDRFLFGHRQWISRSRFQPLGRIQDAFRLLGASASDFVLSKTAGGMFTATIRIGERTCTASGQSGAATIAVAVARAIGIDVPDELLEEREG